MWQNLRRPRLWMLLTVMGLLPSPSSLRAQSQACTFPGEPLAPDSLQLKKLVSGLQRPVAAQFDPLRPGAYWVVEQIGVIKTGRMGEALRVALDLRPTVDASSNEMGLLGLALHPHFRQQRKAYVNYTLSGPLRTRISEFTVADDGSFTRASERVLLEFRQPYTNHNGGTLQFGPDGYLYVGTGDGGSGNDPQNNAQNLGSYLGKMLRLDVNRRDGTKAYGIPADNPFRGREGALPEIYAYGLRNPWKFSFDRITGKLWAGDVGQDFLEEIDIVEAGKNYGWKIMEGNTCRGGGERCDRQGLTEPVTVYPRSEGYSVTGGYVYRGARYPNLIGTYLYADYGSGHIWGLPLEGENQVGTPKKLVASSRLSISSFAEDNQGELYVIDHSGGSIYELNVAPARRTPAAASFPMNLSETGCFSNLQPLTPLPAFVPLQVNAPLWSDGAQKQRFVMVPAGQTLGFHADAPWDMPLGTVLIKNFAITAQNSDGSTREQMVETRFLVRKADGVKAYTYRWNEEATEAQIVLGALKRRVTVPGEHGPETYDHYYPSPSDCLRCHVPNKADALALRTPQLNKLIQLADGRRVNQLQWFVERGLIPAGQLPTDLGSLPVLQDPADTALPVEGRARSWLDVQCASCHNPIFGTTQANFDARYHTEFAATKLCDAAPRNGDLGVEGARLLAPGEVERSLIYRRTASLDPSVRMPAIASHRLDTTGLAVLKEWIGGIGACP